MLGHCKLTSASKRNPYLHQLLKCQSIGFVEAEVQCSIVWGPLLSEIEGEGQQDCRSGLNKEFREWLQLLMRNGSSKKVDFFLIFRAQSQKRGCRWTRFKGHINGYISCLHNSLDVGVVWGAVQFTSGEVLETRHDDSLCWASCQLQWPSPNLKVTGEFEHINWVMVSQFECKSSKQLLVLFLFVTINLSKCCFMISVWQGQAESTRIVDYWHTWPRIFQVSGNISAW